MKKKLKKFIISFSGGIDIEAKDLDEAHEIAMNMTDEEYGSAIGDYEVNEL